MGRARVAVAAGIVVAAAFCANARAQYSPFASPAATEQPAPPGQQPGSSMSTIRNAPQQPGQAPPRVPQQPIQQQPAEGSAHERPQPVAPAPPPNEFQQ